MRPAEHDSVPVASLPVGQEPPPTLSIPDSRQLLSVSVDGLDNRNLSLVGEVALHIGWRQSEVADHVRGITSCSIGRTLICVICHAVSLVRSWSGPGPSETSQPGDLERALLPAVSELLEPSSDVDRVISQAFEVASDKCHLNGNGYGDARGGEFGGQIDMQVVDLVVSQPE